MVEEHVKAATGGLTHSEVSATYIAHGNALSIVFGATAWTLRPRRITVPPSVEALESKHLAIG